ncbi:MAG: CoA transferase, partial [Candidatus Dormibacteraceae bacterium]
WIAMAGSTQSVAIRVFEAIGRPDLILDPRFNDNRSRVANVEALDAIVGAWVAERTQEEAIRVLVAAEVAVAPIWDIRDLASDPHLAARESIVAVEDAELGQIRMPGVQPRLSETPWRVRHAGPSLGEHNQAIYRDRMGLSDEEISSLLSQGVI